MLARLIALSCSLAVAACQTPAELKQIALHASMASPLPADQTAICLQRALENASSFISTRLSPLPNSVYELNARSGDSYVFAILEVTPDGRRSWIEYWLDPSFISTPRETLGAYLARCR